MLVPEGVYSTLPTSGPAWDAMLAAANSLSGAADIDNQDEKQGEKCLAAAYVAKITGNITYYTKVDNLLDSAPESENGGRTLALGRNLAAYVIAAEAAAHRTVKFTTWLRNVRTESLDGDTLISTHEGRPNNWGTACGASRVAAAIYLKDEIDLARAAKVFYGWLGNRSEYAGFDYGDLKWQADPSKPVGINPKGAMLGGYSVDGCLPDDQRRVSGTYADPPAANYVRAAITHSFVTATLLYNAGYTDVFEASDSALKRAVLFFRDRCHGTFTGDDAWAIPLIEWAYPDLEVGADVPDSVGKTMAWSAWTHGNWSRGDIAPPPPPPPPPDPDPTDPCAAVKAELATANTLLAESIGREQNLRDEVNTLLQELNLTERDLQDSLNKLALIRAIVA